MHTLYTFLMVVFWLGCPILLNISTNRMTFIYQLSEEELGFKVKERTWGPVLRDFKRVARKCSNPEIVERARISILLWRFGYTSAILALILMLCSRLLIT